MSHLIRQAQPRDIPVIMSLEHEAFSPDCWENEEVYISRMKVFPQGFLVIEEDGEFAGTITSEIWHHSQEINPHTFSLGHAIEERHKRDGNELYISSIAVFKRFRGHHYGYLLVTQLLDSIGRHYPNVEQSILIVSTEWLPAYHTYQRIGYQTVTQIPHFFGGKYDKVSDGIVMVKRLKP